MQYDGVNQDGDITMMKSIMFVLSYAVVLFQSACPQWRNKYITR